MSRMQTRAELELELTDDAAKDGGAGRIEALYKRRVLRRGESGKAGILPDEAIPLILDAEFPREVEIFKPMDDGTSDQVATLLVRSLGTDGGHFPECCPPGVI